MLDVVARARELDQFAATHDAQLALLLRAKAAAWTPGFVQQCAARHGFVPGAVPGRLVLPAADEGAPPVLVLSFDPQAALAEDPEVKALHLTRLAEALERGAVASLVVAGGAGTRFGAAVKGLVPVLGDRTFLDLKLADARRAGAPAGRPVPVAVMTSAATHGPIVEAVGGAPDVLVFQQRMLPRLTPSLAPYRGAQHRPPVRRRRRGTYTIYVTTHSLSLLICSYSLANKVD